MAYGGIDPYRREVAAAQALEEARRQAEEAERLAEEAEAAYQQLLLQMSGPPLADRYLQPTRRDDDDDDPPLDDIYLRPRGGVDRRLGGMMRSPYIPSTRK